MPTTDTQVSQLIINRLTKTQFEGVSPSSTQLWAVDPEFVGGKLLETTADGDIVESSQTIPTKTSDLSNDSGFITSSALSGYATETWVGQQGFLTSTALNGYATETWVGQQGYITGITSSDVTTALGYTPYDASNPNGYTSNTGTVTSVNNVSPVSGNVTLSIPTDTNDLTNGAGYITSSALSGYATETWVGNQGYITGIDSSDVTTALGYTPYSDANPNGYTSNVGTVTSVNNTSPDGNGNVSISIPSEVTETTVSNWGFTKNTGTVTSVNNVSPVNGNVTLSIPTVNNSTITIQKNGTTVDSFTTNASSNKSINITVPTSASDVSALPSSTKYGADLSYSSNTLQLKDQDGNNLGSPVTISGGGSLPSQTGQSGKFLTTDGTDASWASIPSDSSKLDTDFSNMNPSASSKKTIDSWGMPDYDSGVSRSHSTDYTETTNGWIQIYTTCYNSSSQVAYLYINDVQYRLTSSGNGHFNPVYLFMPIPAGTKYKLVEARSDSVHYFNYFPCKGG